MLAKELKLSIFILLILKHTFYKKFRFFPHSDFLKNNAFQIKSEI